MFYQYLSLPTSQQSGRIQQSLCLYLLLIIMSMWGKNLLHQKKIHDSHLEFNTTRGCKRLESTPGPSTFSHFDRVAHHRSGSASL